MDQYFKLTESLNHPSPSSEDPRDHVMRSDTGPPKIKPVVLDTTSWNQAIESQLPELLSSWRAESPDKPPVVSARFKGRRIKTSSYYFSETGPAKRGNRSSIAADLFDPYAPERVADPVNEECKSGAKSKEKKVATRTRMKAPADVIKLEDRLFYLLQPPLENLLDGKTMEFPFEPFPFQYAGIAFLFPRNSAILADEMGLGKTMQTIATVRMLLRAGFIKSVLIICPKPLVTNWQREFKSWAPEITVAAIKGNQHQRAWHWKTESAMVKLANYELLTRDEALVTAPENEFDLVILDEAQRIKNKANATSEVVHRINRKRSWALTGTPIENGVEDLVGICEFAAKGAVSSGMTAREMRVRVKDLILRRTKDVVMKDMPPRLMRDAELELSPEQQISYDGAEKDGVLRLNDMGDELTIKHVFELVLRLKQICNFDPATGMSSKIERLKADMEEVAASGQKAIVFSQWVDSLEVIGKQLTVHRPLEYHGRIPSKQRDPILKEFKENPDRKVLLMSYGAGAVGLNLQFCRYVFLFDRWWNPAIEDQAINRAHRIGAAGSVTITRMIMAGTIEQRIHQILEEKRELFREILSDGDTPAKRGLSRNEIFGLFDLTTPKGKITPVNEVEDELGKAA
ncbi:MAG: DEAD/DEAH box helicase [Planctomycetaceae bacterium]|nr:DEAD/DEAH box helicase [Planctomycetaceae bacterium]